MFLYVASYIVGELGRNFGITKHGVQRILITFDAN